MKERLIALMVAGLIATGSLVGCSTENEIQSTISFEKAKMSGAYRDEAGRITDKNISVEQKGKYVLHKGDIVFFEKKAGQASTSVDVNKMQFDCGTEIYTNATYYLSDDDMAEELYDEKCEDCFGVN